MRRFIIPFIPLTFVGIIFCLFKTVWLSEAHTAGKWLFSAFILMVTLIALVFVVDWAFPDRAVGKAGEV